MADKTGWVERETPYDPHRRSAELIAELLDECPFTVLIGFDKEPEGLYADIERLGGVELCSCVSSGGTALFRAGSRWRRFLFRLEFACRRIGRRVRRRLRT
jgi:hypothetical protein